MFHGVRGKMNSNLKIFPVDFIQFHICACAHYTRGPPVHGLMHCCRFCVGDRFYLCENKILCEYDYEERVMFANMEYNPPSFAHLKRQTSHLPVSKPTPIEHLPIPLCCHVTSVVCLADRLNGPFHSGYPSSEPDSLVDGRREQQLYRTSTARHRKVKLEATSAAISRDGLAD
jgi:hypothetical protein